MRWSEPLLWPAESSRRLVLRAGCGIIVIPSRLWIVVENPVGFGLKGALRTFDDSRLAIVRVVLVFEGFAVVPNRNRAAFTESAGDPPGNPLPIEPSHGLKT